MALFEVKDCLRCIAVAVNHLDSVHHHCYVIIETLQYDSTVFYLLYGVIGEVEDSKRITVRLRLHNCVDKSSFHSIAVFEGVSLEL